MIEIRHYVSETGNDYYQQWLDHLKDRTAKARITVRVNRLSAGAFGDCKPLGRGVWELRIDHGPGYRLYYAQVDRKLVLLLIGGDKRQQQTDIAKALRCWNEYQESKP